uniref:Carbonic anhydrase n=1 Tax=Rhodnius prolixus TaxID=13249 RepID=A0A4P6DFP0_RHOPR
MNWPSFAVDNWPNNKMFQSPINICLCKTKKADFPPLLLENFDFSADLKVTNNGRTLQVKTKQASLPSITGGPLRNKYYLENFHFHWGRACEGSEHLIDGKRFSMEGHFVFTREYKLNISLTKLEKIRQTYYYKKCLENCPYCRTHAINVNDSIEECINEIKLTHTGDFEAEVKIRTEQNVFKEAEKHLITWLEEEDPDENPCDKIETTDKFWVEAVKFSNPSVKLATVVALFFLVTKDAKPYALLEKTEDVIPLYSAIEENGELLAPFVSSMNLEDYFTYSGSSTSHPYPTNVVWIVLRDPLYVSRHQMELLRKMRSAKGGYLTENFRSVQELGGREVYYINKET